MAPDGELVLDEDADLVGGVVPGLRRKTDAIAQAVPMHFLDPLVQQANPSLAPGQIAAFGVLEKPVEREVAAAHEIGLSV